MASPCKEPTMPNVAEIMTTDVQVIGPEETLQAAAQLMDQRNVGALPVCSGKYLQFVSGPCLVSAGSAPVGHGAVVAVHGQGPPGGGRRPSAVGGGALGPLGAAPGPLPQRPPPPRAPPPRPSHPPHPGPPAP